MLYFRLRERSFRSSSPGDPGFPGTFCVTFEFVPPWPFGVKSGECLTRTAFCAVDADGHRKSRIRTNWHAGRVWPESTAPLVPIAVSEEIGGMRIDLDGTRLKTLIAAENLDDLHSIISRVYYWLPVFLNLEFGDSPAIASVTVVSSASGAEALWVPKTIGSRVWLTTREVQQENFRRALRNVLDDSVFAEPRLMAAMDYFYAAARLQSLGESPGEFMAEVLLNLSKILEVLFPSSSGALHDNVRKALVALGYSRDEVEWKFVPALILRNQLGVGHPRLSPLSEADLDIVHRYVDSAESDFRELLERIRSLPAEQRCFLMHEDSGSSCAELIGTLSRMRGNLAKLDIEFKSVTITNPPPPIAPRSKY